MTTSTGMEAGKRAPCPRRGNLGRENLMGGGETETDLLRGRVEDIIKQGEADVARNVMARSQN